MLNVTFSPAPTALPSSPKTVTTYWEAHNVYIPDPKTHKWIELEFTPELLSFPGGKHDDQVDCMSQALNDLTSRNNTIDPSNILALMKEFR